MSYEKGTFAFFDGTSTAYRKALKLSDSIAGYKVMNITPDAVNLAAGTNQVELKVGMQLRREDQGPWSASSQSTSYSDASTSTTSSTPSSVASSSSNAPAASSGSESDILKRLMQRREQE
jgi:flavin-binding protein dodecin